MVNKLTTVDWIALVLVIIGGLNWGLVAFNYNVVDAIFGMGSPVATIVYILVGLSALYLAVMSGKLARK
ncbi:MAG: DUF378 domain-containing protein [Patescibacteria group bacterium]